VLRYLNGRMTVWWVIILSFVVINDFDNACERDSVGAHCANNYRKLLSLFMPSNGHREELSRHRRLNWTPNDCDLPTYDHIIQSQLFAVNAFWRHFLEWVLTLTSSCYYIRRLKNLYRVLSSNRMLRVCFSWYIIILLWIGTPDVCRIPNTVASMCRS